MNHRDVSGDISYWFELTFNYSCVQRGSWQYGDSDVAGSADWVDDEYKYFIQAWTSLNERRWFSYVYSGLATSGIPFDPSVRYAFTSPTCIG